MTTYNDLNMHIRQLEINNNLNTILHISTGGALNGGAELCLIELIQQELLIGVTPYVILPFEGELSDWLTQRNIEYYILNATRWMKLSSERNLTSAMKFFPRILKEFFINIKMKRILELVKPDLLHINTSVSNLGLKSALEMKIPVVWHLREFNDARYGRNFLSIQRTKRHFQSANQFIAVSKAIEKYYQDFFNIKAIDIVYDSVEKPKIINKKKNILRNKVIKIYCVSNIVSFKGQKELVEALVDLKKCVSEDVEVYFIGEEEDKDYCRSMKKIVFENDLSEYVHFLGKCSNVYSHLANADISVMCSFGESYGRATVEGMLSGCLVIGRDDSAGTSELLSDGHGILYKDASSLAASIKWAIDNQNEANLIAKNGQEFAIKLCDDRRSFNEIFHIFSKALSG